MAEEIGGISTTIGVNVDMSGFSKSMEDMGKSVSKLDGSLSDMGNKMASQLTYAFSKIDGTPIYVSLKDGLSGAIRELGAMDSEISRIGSNDGISSVGDAMRKVAEIAAEIRENMSKGIKITDEKELEVYNKSMDEALQKAKEMSELDTPVKRFQYASEQAVSNLALFRLVNEEAEKYVQSVGNSVEKSEVVQHGIEKILSMITKITDVSKNIYNGVDMTSIFKDVENLVKNKYNGSEDVLRQMKEQLIEVAMTSDRTDHSLKAMIETISDDGSKKSVFEDISKYVREIHELSGTALNDGGKGTNWEDYYGGKSKSEGFSVPEPSEKNGWKIYWDDVKDSMSKVKDEGGNLKGMFEEVKGLAMGYLGVSTVKNFLTEAIKVRQEFEQYEKKLEIVTGSAAKARDIFAQIKEYGAETNLDFKAMNQATIKMLQQGVSYKEVVSDMKMLGDIAMDDGAKLQQLANIFGKVRSQGEFTQAQYKQLVNQGFNPLRVISEATGESIDLLKSKMKKHELGLDTLREAMRLATSEGGQFYKAVEKQTDTLKGAFDGLQTNMQYLYDEIGKHLAEPAKNVINFLSKLITNYRQVGEILAWVVGAYGTYKAVMMLVVATEKAKAMALAINNAAQSKNILLTKQATAATILMKNAQLSLNSSLKAMTNPYALAVIAVAALSYGIYKLVTAQDEADKSIKKMGEHSKEAADGLAKEKAECDYLFGKLSALDEKSKEYQQTKDLIKNKYGDYLSLLDDEKKKLDDIAGAHQGIIAAMQEKWKYQALDAIKGEYIAGLGNVEVESRMNLRDLTQRKISGNSEALGAADAKMDAILQGIMQGKYTEMSQIQEAYGDFINSFVRTSKQRGSTGASYEVTDNSLVTNILGTFRSAIEQKKKLDAEMAKNEDLYKNSWDPNFGKKEKTPEEEEEEERLRRLREARLARRKKEFDQHIKIIDEYAKLLRQRDAEIRKINEDVGLSELEKQTKTADINKRFNWQLTEAQAKGKLSDDEVRALQSQYSERQDIETKSLNELYAYKGELQRKLQEKQNEYGRVQSQEELYAVSQGYDQLLTEIQRIDDQIDEKDFDFVKRTQSYKEFADKVSEVYLRSKESLKDSSKETKELGKTLNLLQMVKRGRNGEEIDISVLTKNQQKQLREYSRMTNEELDRNVREVSAQMNKIAENTKDIFESTKRDVSELVIQYSGVENGLNTELEQAISDIWVNRFNEGVEGLDAMITQLTDKLRTEQQATQTAESAKKVAMLTAQLKACKAALESLKSEELKKEDGSDNDYWHNLRDHYNQWYEAISKVTKALNSLSDAVGGNAGRTLKSLATITDTTLNLGKNIIDFGDLCQELIKETASGTQKAMKSIETASAILEIIALVFQLIDALKQLFSKTDAMEEFRESMEETRKSMRDARHEMENESMRTGGDSIFGKDSWGKFAANSRIAIRALEDFNDTRSDVIGNASTLGGWHKEASEGIALLTGFSINAKKVATQVKGQYKTLEDTIANMYVKVQHKTWFRGEKGTTLRDAVPELFNSEGKLDYEMLKEFVGGGSSAFEALSKENKEYLEDLSKQWEEYQAAMEAMKEQMSSWFGSLGNDIINIWADAFESGEDGLAQFEEVWDKSMESMAKTMIYNLTIGKTFQDLEKEIDAMGFYEDPDAKQRELLNLMNSYKDKFVADQESANAMFQTFHDELGLFNSNSEATRNAITSGIANMSQDSAEEMNGRMTQIQSHTLSINEQVIAMRELANQQLVLLQGIKGDTGRLEAIEQSIASLDVRIGDIQAYGIKLKQ